MTKSLSSPGNNEKVSLALESFKSNIMEFLATLMKHAGFEESETEPSSPTFTKYIKLSLIQIAEMVQKLKEISQESLNVEEKQLIADLVKDTLLEVDPKMECAMNIFKKAFPSSLKSLMLIANFQENEREEGHFCYVNFFSNAFILLGKIYFDQKSSNKAKSDSFLRVNSLFTYQEKKMDADIWAKEDIDNMIFSHVELLQKTKKHELFCASYENRKYLLKVLPSSCPHKDDIAHLDAECRISKQISHPAIRKCLGRTRYLGKETLILEWIEGTPIANFETWENFNLKDFLSMARDITDVIRSLHNSRLIFMNLTCGHIMFDRESKSLKIISLGSASSFGTSSATVGENVQNIDLRYISPELTRKMGRNIDYRCDFYSLGVVLYKVATGDYPFHSEDLLQLINMHISKDPYEPCVRNKKIPILISDFILKLMEKYAENRYLSANGIIHDLDLMLSEYGKLANISLGTYDNPNVFLLPQKLYNRDKEYDTLCRTYDELNLNPFQLVFISGNHGTGKSVLARELYKHIASRKGMVITGNFSKQKTRPLSAIVEAFGSFCHDLLLRDRRIVEKYKARIVNALQEEGILLTEIIDNLHLIIGQQPAVVEDKIFIRERKHRVYHLLINFLKALCFENDPLVVLLEDLHLADKDSIEFLSTILSDNTLENFMLVCTFRENEISNNDPIWKLMSNERVKKPSTITIKLSDSDVDEVNKMISDIFRLPTLQTYDITSFLFKSSNGNMLFLCQMLRSLYNKNEIFYCNDVCMWKLSILDWKEKDRNEDITQFFKNKILAFPTELQQALRIASFFGGPFPLKALRIVTNQRVLFDDLIGTEMLVSCKGGNLRFSHNFIQEAAFSLQPENPGLLFLYISRKLITSFTHMELKQNIYIIANLLLNSTCKLCSSEESLKFASVLFDAGRKSIKSLSFSIALDYLDKGVEFLGRDGWKSNYNISLEYHNMAAKAAYCDKNDSRLTEIANVISRHARFPFDTVYSLELQARFLNERGMYREALKITDEILGCAGIKTRMSSFQSVKPEEIELVKQLIEAKRDDKKTLNVKPMTNNLSLAVIRIYSNSIICSAIVNLQLILHIAMQIIILSLNDGLCNFSAVGFCAFGGFLCRKGDESGYHYGKIALALSERFQNSDIIPYIFTCFFTFISPLYEPLQHSIQPLLYATQRSIKQGRVESINHSVCCYCQIAFLSGKPLQEVLAFIEEVSNIPNMIMFPVFFALQQTIVNLMNDDGDSELTEISRLVGDHFNSQLFLNNEKERFFASKVLLFCIILSFMFHDFDEAPVLLSLMKSMKHFFTSTFRHPHYIFYEGLLTAAMYRNGHKSGDKFKALQNCVTMLQETAKKCAENVLNKICLLEAELAALEGNSLQAMKLYKEAIFLSKKMGLLHEEAIALENAGTFMKEQNLFDDASRLLRRSYLNYKAWGSTSKCIFLKKKYPTIFCLEFGTSDCKNVQEFAIEAFTHSVSLVSDLSITIAQKKRKRDFSS